MLVSLQFFLRVSVPLLVLVIVSVQYEWMFVTMLASLALTVSLLLAAAIMAEETKDID